MSDRPLFPIPDDPMNSKTNWLRQTISSVESNTSDSMITCVNFLLSRQSTTRVLVENSPNAGIGFSNSQYCSPCKTYEQYKHFIQMIFKY